MVGCVVIYVSGLYGAISSVFMKCLWGICGKSLRGLWVSVVSRMCRGVCDMCEICVVCVIVVDVGHL